MKFNFEKLEVYNDALEYAKHIYAISKHFPKDEMFGITNQLRRATVSISSNIAEGSSRGKRGFTHFLNIALGSSYECVPLLQISQSQQYIGEEDFRTLMQMLHKICAKISALKSSLQR
jgi:four helix bundle protein